MSDMYLSHYGVKGMKWGVRRSRSDKAGRKAPKPKAPDPRTLSDADLRAAVSRMQLERQYTQLMRSREGQSLAATGAAFLGGIAMNVARSQIQTAASQQLGSMLRARMGN